ncbi:MAG: hypothetical protein U5K30_12030 [Acidimicrobiales bacterium]|nr:hypothetical protein [Acidimicrobiales bacterium]
MAVPPAVTAAVTPPGATALVGSFGGDAATDILWCALGTTTDYLWMAIDPAFAQNRRIYTCQGHGTASSREVQVIAWTLAPGRPP